MAFQVKQVLVAADQITRPALDGGRDEYIVFGIVRHNACDCSTGDDLSLMREPMQKLVNVLIEDVILGANLGTVQDVSGFGQGCRTGHDHEIFGQPAAQKPIRGAALLDEGADQNVGVNDDFERNWLFPDAHIADGFGDVVRRLLLRDCVWHTGLHAVE